MGRTLFVTLRYKIIYIQMNKSDFSREVEDETVK